MLSEFEMSGRRVAADPEDCAAAESAIIQRARVHGAGVYLEHLAWLNRWKNTSELIQGEAAREYGRRLGPKWEFKDFKHWLCPCSTKNTIHDSGVWVIDNKEVWTRDISHRLATFVHLPTGMEFNLLPGCGERKGHMWYPFQPFLIARHPVTQGVILGCKNAADIDLPMTGCSFPVVNDWCVANGMSLPSAAEWTYACKAGTKTQFYWGDEFDQSHVVYRDNSGYHNHQCVNREFSSCHQPGPMDPRHYEEENKWNAFGLVNMLGNVWEYHSKGWAMGGCFRMTANQFEGSVPQLRSPWQNGVLQGSDQVGFRPIMRISAGRWWHES